MSDVGKSHRPVALVCGATGPIGASCATALAGRGLRVAIHYRHNAAQARSLAGTLPGAASFRAELNDHAQVDELVTSVERSMGAVAVLVNTAHQRLDEPRLLAETSFDTLDAQLSAVRGYLAVLQRVLPPMREQRSGRILYISGGLADRAAAGFSAYAAAKSAAATLTRYVAREEGKYGITANCVAPGPVAGDEGLRVPGNGFYQALATDLDRRLALDRWPDPRDIASVVAFLAGPDARQVTGHTIPVNGGEAP